MNPRLSVLIVNYQSSALALNLIESVLRDKEEDFELEIILVDNCSDVSEQEILRRASLPPQVKSFFLTENTGYGPGNNFAYKQSSGEYILVINPDTLVYPGALKHMMHYLAQHPDCAAVGPKTYWDEEKTFILSPSEPQTSTLFLSVHLGHHFHTLGYSMDRYWLNRSLRFWRRESPSEVQMLSGGCLMMRREVIKHIGLFDPAFRLYFEDTDWCRRARAAGYRLVHLPCAEIVHFGNQSGQKRGDAAVLFEDSRRVYFRKYESSLKCRLFPVLNRWITHFGRTRNKSLSSFFIELGTLRDEPPTLNAVGNGSQEYLLEVSPSPLLIPAFGGFFREPIFRFPPLMWKRLWPGRHFARWLALPGRQIVGQWTWEKV